MLLLEGKSRNRLVLQMRSSKAVYWPPRSSPSSYQQCSTRLSETWGTTRILVRELLVADDSTLVAHSAEEMQKIVDAFSDASKKIGLRINIKKTEMLYQHNSTRTREEDIMADRNKLNSVPEFTYLGSTISRFGRIDDETQRRMDKASASFGRLRQIHWNNRHVSMQVKGKIYRAVVLYTRGLDSVQTTGEKAACLHDATLGSIMRIIWTDKLTTRKYSNGQGCHLFKIF